MSSSERIHDLWLRLRRYLRLQGPTAAAELYRALDINAVTLSRVLAANRDEICSIGRARATRYALRRPVGGGTVEIPIYEVDEHGSTTQLGVMHPVWPDGYIVAGTPEVSRHYPGLPWFLDDLRPCGFLGRLVPYQHPELDLPQNVTNWSVDQAVHYLIRYGSDPVGNLIIGQASLSRYLAPDAGRVPVDDRASAYPRFAADAMAAGVPGSSAGGEQPKFLASVRDGDEVVPSLIKFSQPMSTELGRRVADLLVSEHIALTTLGRSGVLAARSSVYQFADRLFLEVERFDRTRSGGRRGLVSLRALDGEFAGVGTDWVDISQALHTSRVISQRSFLRAVWLDLFGDFIGNTDRHPGNLSFHFASGRVGELAPVYDMLPMCYAPRSGEIVPFQFSPPPVQPAYPELRVTAWRAACDFWTSVSTHPMISESFKEIARTNAHSLLAQEDALRRLPFARQ